MNINTSLSTQIDQLEKYLSQIGEGNLRPQSEENLIVKEKINNLLKSTSIISKDSAFGTQLKANRVVTALKTLNENNDESLDPSSLNRILVDLKDVQEAFVPVAEDGAGAGAGAGAA